MYPFSFESLHEVRVLPLLLLRNVDLDDFHHDCFETASYIGDVRNIAKRMSKGWRRHDCFPMDDIMSPPKYHRGGRQNKIQVARANLIALEPKWLRICCRCYKGYVEMFFDSKGRVAAPETWMFTATSNA